MPPAFVTQSLATLPATFSPTTPPSRPVPSAISGHGNRQGLRLIGPGRAPANEAQASEGTGLMM
eukprot:7294594-Alexandrium_andersonii.AAC.1